MGQARALLHTVAAGLTGLAVLTTWQPALAYRTGEDSPDLSGKGRVAWATTNIGFTLSSKGLPEGVTTDEAEQALSAALDAWSGPQCSAAEPYFVGWTDAAPAAKDGLNTIAWATTKEHDFASMSPGDTDVLYHEHDGSWTIAEADIYLDADDYSWTTVDGKDTSVQAVLTHELGHALGLLHPCEPGGADNAPDCAKASGSMKQTTMYPFYSAEQSSLEDDDVAGICYLYPADQTCADACGKDQVCMDGECRTTCGADVCGAKEICGEWGCVPQGSCTLRDCIGQACAGPNTCGPLANCVDGICKGGSSAWGDTCKASTDCADGVCVGAVCQPVCGSDTDCGSGQCLSADDGTARGCVSSGAYDAGLRCSMGEDCKSGICIFTANPSVCTNECKTNDACPATWKCGLVEGKNVCVPPTYHPAGGCAVSPATEAGSNGAYAALAAALGALLTTRLKRRRAR